MMFGVEIFLLILPSNVFGVGVNDSSEVISKLTTAILKSNTFPKPTSVYRRISIDRRLDNVSNSSKDLLKLLETRRKKGHKNLDIWEWDYWCQLQPKKGTCEKTLTRYYYNSQLDKCLPFEYSGCDSNKNNFVTSDDCQRRCEGAGYTHLKDFTDSKFCLLQPSTGFCLALIKRYYFDINDKFCKEFIYGGCGGNQNRFDTVYSCMKMCST